MKGTVESPTEEYMYISVETLRLLCSSSDVYCDIVVPMVRLGLGTTLLVLSSKTRLQIVRKTQFRADKCSNTSGFVAIKTSRKYLNIMPKGFGFAATNTSGKCLDILQKNVKRFHSDRYRNAVTPIAPTSPIWQSAHINVIWIISQNDWYWLIRK